MPRYLLETDVTAPTDFDAAVDMATQRFPEVAVEHCYAEHHRIGARTWWVCQAPSETHVDRWAAAAHLSPLSLRHVDTLSPPTAPVRVAESKRTEHGR
jgi:hypothetical protein